ncbi:hypothetical protein J3D55_001368 [Chryseobacterium ginsenosidimutans]|uniref:hypothetical protein n=1 Tax=Chryseobacterium ginsenosidimutans TaxID=687846 RepID=UPI0021697B9A|nr:hypothetical protein [Chryseobacterium ginsenosidimutans]MCS3868452.1 hypothetical protein [Chryseobacterium ginsenosidimutans]
MAKRNILEKMTTKELEKYISSDSPFVYEAIEIAYDILKNRGVNFSDIKKNSIEGLIKIKKEEDLKYTENNTWDINADNENSDIELYSQKSIWFFSIFLGIHIGAILLAINLFSLTKNRKGLIIIIFGIIYSVFLYITYTITKIYIINYYILILIFMTAIGASILQFYFWDKYLPNIKYRKKSIVFPFILCIVFYSLVLLGIIY